MRNTKGFVAPFYSSQPEPRYECQLPLFAILNITIMVRFIRESGTVMAKQTIDNPIGELIKRDGCYVGHPDERAGSTCWGISHAVARRQDYSGKDLASTKSMKYLSN